MTNIIIFSQNVVLSEESFKHIKNKNIETYILTTNSLFDNENMVFFTILTLSYCDNIYCELFYQDSSINHLLLIGHCSDIGCLQLLQGT